MTLSADEAKFKQFIELSLKAKKIRNATSIVYMLISNKIDEIGLKLGLIPRRKAAHESLSDYMSLINKIFQINFEITIFPEVYITPLKVVELAFDRKAPQDEFSKTYLKELTVVYFAVNHLQIPNLHQHLKDAEIMDNRTVTLMSFLGRKKNSTDNSSPMKAILLQKIRQDLQELKVSLQSSMNQENLVKIIQLKSLERSLLANSKKNRIILSGSLQDNINYTVLASTSGHYGLFGIMFTFIMIGILCITEMLLVGIITAEVGWILLLCVLMTLTISYLIKKGKKESFR
jgi:hypothetical protein